MSKQFYLSIILSAFFSAYSFSQEISLSIRLDFPEYADRPIGIAHYYGENIVLHGEVKLDRTGKAVYEKSGPQGIYLLLLPDSLHYEFLVSQKGSSTIVARNDSLILYSNEEGKCFELFNKLSAEAKSKADSLRSLLSQSGNTDKSVIRSEIQTVRKELDDSLRYLAKKMNGSLAGNYFKALLSYEMPDIGKTGNSSGDSFLWMENIKHYQEHYLDNITWDDARLIYTPVVEDRLITYLEKVVLHSGEGLCRAVDSILARTTNPQMREFILKIMLEKFRLSLQDPVYELAFICLVNKYILTENSSWPDAEMKEKLQTHINKIKYSAIGQPAPEIILPDKNGKLCPLKEPNARITVVIFWDYACPTCRRILDELRKTTGRYNYKNVAVYTVFTGDDEEIWRAWEAKVLSPNWTNTIISGNKTVLSSYNIQRTPSLFLLNRDKVIIDKDFTVRELDEYLFKLP
jgi:peroxiredoxin